MIGYKGIELRNGILRSKYNSIFEIGIPTKIEEVTDSIGFSEIGYSFCGSIEQVIFHENFLKCQKDRVCDDTRLFEVESVGKVIGGNYHYKAEQIIVRREITKDEILSYLDKTPSALKTISKEISLDKLELYRSEPLSDYRLLTSKEEIEQVYIKSCKRLGNKDICCQNPHGLLDITLCEKCSSADLAMNVKTYENDYLYLLARAAILEGRPCDSIVEFQQLLVRASDNKECKYDCESLRLLAEHR